MIETNRGSRREATLPAATLRDLIGAARSTGADTLRAAGREAGRSLAERLAGPGETPATRDLPAAAFWRRTAELFASRGWGTLEHAPAGDGVGEIRLRDSIEADAKNNGACDFTAAMLEGLLEAVAGSRLEVREAACVGLGDPACRFRFGTPAALDAAAGTPA